MNKDGTTMKDLKQYIETLERNGQAQSAQILANRAKIAQLQEVIIGLVIEKQSL